jgi:hypothetical protein
MFGKIKQGFTYLVWKTLPSCKDVTALASRSLENDLSFREKMVLKIHLATCLACQRYLKQIKFLGEVCEVQAEKIEKGKNAPRLSPQAAERLKNALKSSKF